MATPAVREKWPFVINLGNSIIGVALLAMPFCFKQCGMLLGMLVLVFCTWLTLASCQLLMKAGIVSHHRSYEFLAYHTYGAPGKFLVEIGMIGIQLGTLVAQIVVIGDLGPPIFSQLFGIESSSSLRMYLIVFLSLCVGLPLGLMKDMKNVSKASFICIAFYTIFCAYVIWLSLDNVMSTKWYTQITWWEPRGLFRCLPIMSFSFGCQTQLFHLYDALPEPSLHAIKSIIHSAVNLCTVAYLLVGFLGYITFYHVDIPGDVLMVFPSSLWTHLVKLGFVISIAITFPVIIFPCRASIYTLLFQKEFYDRFATISDPSSKIKSDNYTSTYIPEFLFKGITVAIVIGSMITAILIPNVEFILGINGAITGTLICYIFPALFFLRVMSSKAEGKTVAQIVLVLGVSILLVSTYTTLAAQDKGHVQKADTDALKPNIEKPIVDEKQAPALQGIEKDDGDKKKLEPLDPGGGVQLEENPKVNDAKRAEPPNPNAPDPKLDEKKSESKKEVVDTGGGGGGKGAAAGDSKNSVNKETGKDANKVVEKDAKESEKDANKEAEKDAKEAEKAVARELGKVAEVGNVADSQIEADKKVEVKKDTEQDKKDAEQDKRQEKLLDALEQQRKEGEQLLVEQKAILKELKDHKEKDHGIKVEEGKAALQGDPALQGQQENKLQGAGQAQAHSAGVNGGAGGGVDNQQALNPDANPNPPVNNFAQNPPVNNFARNPPVNNNVVQNLNPPLNNPVGGQNPNLPLNNPVMAQNLPVGNPAFVQNPLAGNPALAQNPSVGNPALAQNPSVNNPGFVQNPPVVNNPAFVQNPVVNNPALPPVNNAVVQQNMPANDQAFVKNPPMGNPALAQNPAVAGLGQNPSVNIPAVAPNPQANNPGLGVQNPPVNNPDLGQNLPLNDNTRVGGQVPAVDNAALNPRADVINKNQQNPDLNKPALELNQGNNNPVLEHDQPVKREAVEQAGNADSQGVLGKPESILEANGGVKEQGLGKPQQDQGNAAPKMSKAKGEKFDDLKRKRI